LKDKVQKLKSKVKKNKNSISPVIQMPFVNSTRINELLEETWMINNKN
jgi:hypothetical protein